MKEITINAQARTDLGKKASRDIRRAGNVPCVVYGVEKDENGLPKAQHLVVNQKELAKAVYTPNVYIINLNVDGTAKKVILKELQCDFVKDTPTHVDFYEITEEPIVMAIPVKLNGLAAGVRAGGKLSLSVRKLKVRAPYTKLPDTLDIDVTDLELGKAIKVADLSFEGLELVTPKEVVVCAVRMTRAARSADSAAAAEGEGEAAEAAAE